MLMSQIDQRARALTLDGLEDADNRWQASWSPDAAEPTSGWRATLDTLASMHEHLLAIRSLIADDSAAVAAVGTLARTVIECGARAWWTVSQEEDEHPESRRLLEHLHGIAEFDRIRKRQDVLQMEEPADTVWRIREEAIVAHIARLEEQQGLKVRRNKNQRVIAIDGIERPSMGKVIEDFFDAQGHDHIGIGIYHLGSAVAHGQVAGASDLVGNLDPRTGQRLLEGPKVKGDFATSVAGAALSAEWFALATCLTRWGILNDLPSRPESISSLRRYTAFVVEELPKIARNAPCPCGSGRKYKLCHGH